MKHGHHSMLCTDAPVNGWTGGQYSLYRLVFGVYLLVHFVCLIPWADSALVATVLSVAAGLSVMLAAGYRDRLAAICLLSVWVCLHGRSSLMANPGLPYVGLLLLVHACIPSAPYGSLAARGRVNPGGGWFMPQAIFNMVWLLMVLGYSYSGYTKLVNPSWLDGSALEQVLNNPLARPGLGRAVVLLLPSVVLQIVGWGVIALELFYAPLALVRATRPWMWGLMLCLQVGFIFLIDFTDLNFGMVVLHLFTFDPAWIRPRPAKSSDLVLYDGHCGLCHGATRFLLAEDLPGTTFRFAPLEGDAAKVALAGLTDIPDSIIVRRADGKIRMRSEAVLYLLQRLGGFWHILAFFSGFIPLRLRDNAYDAIARVRRHLFARPADSCPLLPPELRGRFDY